MVNPLTDQEIFGTIGELLVQTRLLMHDVQAAPPLKDTGNDLIAVRNREIRTIQVKARRERPKSEALTLERRYDLLALVVLFNPDEWENLDAYQVFLIPREDIEEAMVDLTNLEEYFLTGAHVNNLF